MTHPNNKTYQDTRKVALQHAAERAGFATWSAMLTAIKNGSATVTKLQRSDPRARDLTKGE